MGRFRKIAIVCGLLGAAAFGAIGVGATGASGESTPTPPHADRGRGEVGESLAAQPEGEDSYAFQCDNKRVATFLWGAQLRVQRSFLTSDSKLAPKKNSCVGEGVEAPSPDNTLECPSPWSVEPRYEARWTPTLATSVYGSYNRGNDSSASDVCFEVGKKSGEFLYRACFADFEDCSAAAVNRVRVKTKTLDEAGLESSCTSTDDVRAAAITSWTPVDGLSLSVDVCFKETETDRGPRYTFTRCDFDMSDDNCTQAKLPRLTFDPVEAAFGRLFDSFGITLGVEDPREDSDGPGGTDSKPSTTTTFPRTTTTFPSTTTTFPSTATT